MFKIFGPSGGTLIKVTYTNFFNNENNNNKW